ncbi:AraC family ligand binding domain-containing protein [Paenibacillus sp. JCM 10914]|uniref:AraC family ligand binding domain-containing protein n=1 Tax=Paenibacillus sp. JCM 10914 TaxID=1236974 RepID=UPI0003CC34D7|nr:AraC family ligand binding domain-containing protein [Paenibacillus sp. JCM 10914]GAE06051.1 transcriptional regulator, AraC family [Paenibacillus sp. JCM 10914]
MAKPFKAEYHDAAGYLDIEYDRRLGYFSMTTDHLHDHYELYYLMSGERIYFINDRSYRVRAGDLVFVDRNAVHKTLDSGRPDHDRMVFYMGTQLLRELAVPPALESELMRPFRWELPILRLPSSESETVARIMEQLIEEMMNPQEGSELLLRHRTFELLLHAKRHHHKGWYAQRIRSRSFTRRRRRSYGI